jgi:hypothetical protein
MLQGIMGTYVLLMVIGECREDVSALDARGATNKDGREGQLATPDLFNQSCVARAEPDASRSHAVAPTSEIGIGLHLSTAARSA